MSHTLFTIELDDRKLEGQEEEKWIWFITVRTDQTTHKFVMYEEEYDRFEKKLIKMVNRLFKESVK